MADEARLSELLLRWEEGRESGQAVSAAELCRDCPQLRRELEKRIGALQAMDAVLGDRRSAIGHRPSAIGHRPTADCRLPTADCRLPTADCRRMDLLRTTEPHPGREIQELLHQRLRVAGLINWCTTVVWLVLPSWVQTFQMGMGRLDYFYTPLAALLANSLLLGLLFSRWPRSLHRLRLLEIALFGLLAAVLAWSQPRWLLQVVGQRPDWSEKVMILAGDSISLPWFALIVVYGTYIPNTWRRCAVLVGTFALLPLLLAATAGVIPQGLQLERMPDMLLDIALWMGIGSAIAIYGCHKISVLRQEALEARRLGPYVLKRRLGAGGMGEVYLAEHRLLRRPCALKLISPDQAGDLKNLLRFEREVQAMATLTHWNTVEIYDYGHTEDGTFYYVMEYLPGWSLEELVEDSGPLPPGRVVHLLRQVCQALREAHAIGLIHRDIKPGNIIVCQRGGVGDVVKLLDFGLVQVPQFGAGPGRLTLEGTVVGTPLYMSAEQAAGLAELDGRSDLYSLGAVAYALLTGRPPFQGPTIMKILSAHMSEPAKPLKELRPDTPPDLEAVVLRCLAKEPNQRYPDAASLEKALAECACAGQWTQDLADRWWKERMKDEG